MNVKLFSSQRFLAIYSGVLTVAFAATILTGFAKKAQNASFAEINVGRINLREPDGTLRMVISNKAQFPGIIIKGKEVPHPGRETGGVLFFNDEGTENGGMGFGGEKAKDGAVSSYGHLSFDEYEQDQVLTLDSNQEGTKRSTRIAIVDRPDYPIQEILALLDRIKNLSTEQKKAEEEKFFAAKGSPHQRLYMGRAEDKSVSLRLKDVDGHDRLVIQVAADGSPALQLLDQNGKVVSKLPRGK